MNAQKLFTPVRNPRPEWIIALRHKRGWTQTEAAHHWMTTLSTLQRWEAPVGAPNHCKCHPMIWKAMKYFYDPSAIS